MAALTGFIGGRLGEHLHRLAEQERVNSQYGLDGSLGGAQFELHQTAADGGQVGMSIRMVANIVPFRINPP